MVFFLGHLYITPFKNVCNNFFSFFKKIFLGGGIYQFFKWFKKWKRVGVYQSLFVEFLNLRSKFVFIFLFP